MRISSENALKKLLTENDLEKWTEMWCDVMMCFFQIRITKLKFANGQITTNQQIALDNQH